MDLPTQFNDLKALFEHSPNPSLAQRMNVLKMLRRALQAEARALAQAISKDFLYRSFEDTLLLEVLPTQRAIDFCMKHTKRWVKKRKRVVPWILFPAKAYLLPQPLGIVGIVVPWNYPLYLALVPAIYALAAGNRVMIKISEYTPYFGLKLKSLIKNLNLECFIIIVNGDVDVAQQFVSLPFGHLFFTGSSSVGKKIMSAASENLTPLTLELGGKSPVLVSSTMNRDHYNRLFMGKLRNGGQTCIAPDYLLVPSEDIGTLEKECSLFINTYYPDLMHNQGYSGLISEAHKERLLALLDDAREKGARIVCYGNTEHNTGKLPLYLIFNVTAQMQVMQEEIFGPLLPVMTYKSLEEALNYIKSKPHPLVFYYFGEDKREYDLIERTTLSGALVKNDTLTHVAVDDLPFGGVGQSGIGCYHGQEGFNLFSLLKPVFLQRRWSFISLLYPPYGIVWRFLFYLLSGIKAKE